MAAPHKPSALVLYGMLKPPHLLHRLGLLGIERLFGQRWIALTTTGRRTGRPHTVLLDLIDHEAATGRYFIQPGWPRGSDWVRNVEKTPEVTAQVGRTTLRGRVVRVDGAEGARRALHYAKAHPVHTWMVGRLMLGWNPPAGGDAAVEDWMAQNLVFLAVQAQ